MPLLPDPPTFQSLGAAQLMALERPVATILARGPAPLLTSKSLALLYGPRGLGKSHVALGIARAVAAGGRFLDWQAPQPRHVLYVDGEMAAADVQARLRLFGPEVPDTLSFLLADLYRQNEGLPDLGSFAGYNELARIMKPAPELLVLDNLASLVAPRYRPSRPNRPDGDRWSALQRFLLHMRRSSIATLIVHHADKNGQQRGTSRHEDLLDLVLALRPPKDRAPSDAPTGGAHFELHVEKARGLWGDAVAPIEARLVSEADGSGARWEWQPVKRDSDLERVAALLRKGMNPSQIAHELGISKSRCYRLREKVTKRMAHQSIR